MCKRGRPRETWRRTIEAEMKTTGKTWKELEKAAMEREQWKSLVAALCAFYILRIKVSKSIFFFASQYFLKDKENMFSVFLSSSRNMNEN